MQVPLEHLRRVTKDRKHLAVELAATLASVKGLTESPAQSSAASAEELGRLIAQAQGLKRKARPCALSGLRCKSASELTRTLSAAVRHRQAGAGECTALQGQTGPPDRPRSSPQAVGHGLDARAPGPPAGGPHAAQRLPAVRHRPGLLQRLPGRAAGRSCALSHTCTCPCRP